MSRGPRTSTDRSRRSFLDWLLGTTLGGFLVSVTYPVVRYWTPPETAEAATSAVSLDLDPASVTPNSGRIFKFGSDPGILVRTPAGDLRAFTAVCTHLACTVQYRDDLEHIWCACHNGHFDLHGRNIGGPPPRPLEEYDVRETGTGVQISRKS